MEASVVAPPTEPDVAEPDGYDGEAEVTRTTEELFEWSGFVHVGGDAVTCERQLDGCEDTDHFHGWICLPNSFQIRDIDDKARAAEARKILTLRDAGDPAAGRDPSDSYVTLEAALEAMTYDDDELERAKSGIVKRAVDRQLPSLIEEMAVDEQFKHQHQHAEEMRRMVELPPDERDEEEFAQLRKILDEYGNEFEKRVDGIRERERSALDGLPLEQIVDIERRNRIRNIAEETYLHTYYTWIMYACTYEPVSEGLPTKRKFASLQQLKSSPPEVVRDLRQKITALETRTTKRGDAAGNS